MSWPGRRRAPRQAHLPTQSSLYQAVCKVNRTKRRTCLRCSMLGDQVPSNCARRDLGIRHKRWGPAEGFRSPPEVQKGCRCQQPVELGREFWVECTAGVWEPRWECAGPAEDICQLFQLTWTTSAMAPPLTPFHWLFPGFPVSPPQCSPAPMGQ